MKYFCYDSALNEEYTLIQLMRRYPKYTNIFEGTDDAGIWDAAPWLFELNSNPYELRGQKLIQLHHTCILETKDSITNVLDYLHSKIFLNENGRSIYFRIWDATVFLKFLQNGDIKDISDFYNVFTAFYTENDDDAFLDKWEWKGGGKISSVKVLKSEALPVIKSEEELDREYEDSRTPKQFVSSNAPLDSPREIVKKPEEPLSTEQHKRRRFLTD